MKSSENKCIREFVYTIILFFASINIQAQSQPNILLIIADDLGVDVSNGYHQSQLRPTTPTLDSLRAVGLTFENVWVTPRCSPTRATIMSGLYGNKTGVLGTPGNLDTSFISIFKALSQRTNNSYADALIGKWHLSSPANPDHPEQHGADYFMGILGASPADYYGWARTEGGVTVTDSSYVTSTITDRSIEWINEQEKPWFLWLAHPAPHAPFHEPPADLYYINNTPNNFRKYIAMIEAMDTEIQRLIQNIPADELDNTIVIYIGDNGTPSGFVQDYPAGRGKSTLYQGGIRVPLIVSGGPLQRKGERESALINGVDLYSTILELAGANLPGGGLQNSLSFDHLLNGETGPLRPFNFTEINNNGINGWAIRDQQYKLIEFADGSQEMYDLLNDSLEFNNLLEGTLSIVQTDVKALLENEAQEIRSGWSCQDLIQNGDEQGIDCGGSSCTPCTVTNTEDLLNEQKISLYPNPVKDYLQLAGPIDKIERISIYNIHGVLQFQFDGNYSNADITIGNLSPQLYLLEVQMPGSRQVLKFVKQ